MRNGLGVEEKEVVGVCSEKSMHLKPNALRHTAEHKLRDATQPHAVVGCDVDVISAVSVWMRDETFQFMPTILRIEAEIQSDLRIAFAKAVQEGVCTIHHGQCGMGTRPRWNHGKPTLNPIVFKGYGEVCLSATKASCLT